MRQLKIATKITNRDSFAIEKYLQEIGTIPMITPDEERDLAVKIRAGDKNALDKLTNANLRFVVSVAKQYQSQGLSLPDLINEGNLGLIKAAKRFDETKGFKFISYAVWWIRQSILQALAENARIVRLPLNKIGAYNKVQKAQQSFAQEHERDPSIEELSELIDMPEYELELLLQSNMRHESLDAPLSDGDDTTRSDMLDGENPADTLADIHDLRNDLIKCLKNRLTERSFKMMILFYGLDGKKPMTIEEIGDMPEFDLSKERVRQVIERAKERLKRSKPVVELLRKYLN